MVNKSIEKYYKCNIFRIDDNNKVFNSNVQSDALISNSLVYYYLLTEPKNGIIK